MIYVFAVFCNEHFLLFIAMTMTLYNTIRFQIPCQIVLLPRACDGCIRSTGLLTPTRHLVPSPACPGIHVRHLIPYLACLRVCVKHLIPSRVCIYLVLLISIRFVRFVVHTEILFLLQTEHHEFVTFLGTEFIPPTPYPFFFICPVQFVIALLLVLILFWCSSGMI